MELKEMGYNQEKRESQNVDIIFGPPGTGKTKTLMDIIDFEVNEKRTPLNRLAYVTFTRRGIEEGVSRIKQSFDISNADIPYFKTLHSLAFRVLGANAGNLMDARKYYDFSSKVGMKFTGYYDAELQGGDDKYLFWNDLYRNNPDMGKKMYLTLDTKKANFVREQYYRYKKTFQYIDYTDLIEEFVATKSVVPVDVAIIDEAQDLTSLQWKMVWTAFRGAKRIYIAGDDDQAIYQWSGADVNMFLGVIGNQRVLKESWRLPQKLVDYSSRISSQISNRATKDFIGQERRGEVEYVNDVNEVLFNQHESYLCLARNNVHLPLYEDWIQKFIVPYSIKGEPVIKDKDIKAIMEYEEIRKTHMMSDAQESKFSRVRDKSSTLKDPWYDAFNWDEKKKLLLRSLIAEKRITEKPKVNIATIHSVKGGEADNVVILSDVTRPVYDQLQSDPDSEHRVYYVAATRAKKKIIVVKPKTKYFYEGL